MHGIEAIPETSPVEAHQNNGVIEHAAGELAGQARALNDQLQLAYGTALPTNHPIHTWMVNHAGFLISRFQAGVGGKTPYQLLKGKLYTRPLARFGERVHYMPVDTSKTRLKKLV